MERQFTVISTFVIALACACALQSANAAKKEKSGEAKSGSLSAADKKFAEAAAKGGMMEVAMGKAAADHSQNSDVKKFGNRMVKDHSKANDELKSIASKKGITLPSESPTHEFKGDAGYMQMMVKDHEKDLAEFQKEAQNGSDPDLKKFADKTAKVVSDHLAMARDINKKLKH